MFSDFPHVELEKCSPRYPQENETAWILIDRSARISGRPAIPPFQGGGGGDFIRLLVWVGNWVNLLQVVNRKCPTNTLAEPLHPPNRREFQFLCIANMLFVVYMVPTAVHNMSTVLYVMALGAPFCLLRTWWLEELYALLKSKKLICEKQTEKKCHTNRWTNLVTSCGGSWVFLKTTILEKKIIIEIFRNFSTILGFKEPFV